MMALTSIVVAAAFVEFSVDAKPVPAAFRRWEGTNDCTGYLGPAVNRQPGYRREDS